MRVPPLPDNAPPVVGAAYELMLWLIPKVEHLPRVYRFTVGERLVSHGLDLLTALVEAAYVHDKRPMLPLANRRVNSLRYLLRLSKDLSWISVDAYAFSTGKVDEIGRMVGGWIKSLARTSDPRWKLMKRAGNLWSELTSASPTCSARPTPRRSANGGTPNF